MKKLFLFGIAAILFMACQKQRYFSESTELDSFKASISQYNNGDWETWKTHFVDTAKFYVNSNKAISVDDFRKAHQKLLSNFSSYGFEDKDSFSEMVIDSTNETWVNYWATWHGKFKANDKEIDVPVHLTAQFVNGKVVKIYDYFDSAIVGDVFAEIEKENNRPVEEKTILAQSDKFVNEFLNKQDESVLSTVLDDNYKRYMNEVQDASSPKELAAAMKVFFTAFPDFKIKRLHTSPIVNNMYFVHWQMTGTNTGEFAGSPATGKKVKITGLSRLHFNGEGKIDEEDVFYDQLSLMKQLGHTLN